VIDLYILYSVDELLGWLSLSIGYMWLVWFLGLFTEISLRLRLLYGLSLSGGCYEHPAGFRVLLIDQVNVFLA
jgi:hypothetical protein